MSIYSEFHPTYLYIKEHRLTGMKYLGKTTKPDPDAYLGSGTYWRRHIKKYGKEHVVTVWKQLFTDRESLIETALRLSHEHDVVNSESWANLTIENGLDGLSTGAVFSEEHKAKISKSLKGREKTPEHLKKIAESNTGKTHTEEFKEKCRQRMVGFKLSEEARLKVSQSKIGRPRPDLTERNRKRWEAYRQAKATAQSSVLPVIETSCDQM